MTMTVPGVVTNATRKNGATRDARRMRGLETACELLGGQSALAEAMGINPRHLRQKIAVERPISDADLHLASGALFARAERTRKLAEALAALIISED